jgi:hypothetical protein
MESARRKVGLVLLCALAFGGGAYLIYVLWAGSSGARAPELTLARPPHGTPLGLTVGGGRGGGVQSAAAPASSGGGAQSQWARAQAGGESSADWDDQSQSNPGAPWSPPSSAPRPRRAGSPPRKVSPPGRSSPESPEAPPSVTPTPSQGQQSSPTPSPSPSPTPTPGPSPNPPPTPPPPSGPSFSIALAEGGGAPLYPGAAPQPIALVLGNPSSTPLYVTSLSVTASSGPLGCEPAANLGIVQSDLSSAAPLDLPAHGSVTLPAQGHSAPSIQLLDLPRDQDACQSARFGLSFTGSAHS